LEEGLVEHWPEIRAVFRTPASILDSDTDRENGYVTKQTKPYLTKNDADREAKKNSEETHAWIIGYEERVVFASAWQEVVK
jgi:hypothetical protein